MTSGRRYMYLPFLYDEAAVQVLVRNRKYMEGSGAGEELAGTDSASGALEDAGRRGTLH